MSDAIRRCTGHCCKAFPIPTLNAAGGYEALQGNPQRFQDGEYVLDMLIRRGDVRSVDPVTGAAMVEQEVYGCRHHDPVSGNCTAYAQRPAMCHEYPYDGACRAAGCALGQDCSQTEKAPVPLSVVERRCLTEDCVLAL